MWCRTNSTALGGVIPNCDCSVGELVRCCAGPRTLGTRRRRTSGPRGFAPRLKTYVGRQVPRPLRIDIARGEAEVEVVLRDILALTKLNYNTRPLSDGLPVTLRFADAVGEILTAGPNAGDNPL